MIVKSCKTCDRRNVTLSGDEYDYTGYLCETARSSTAKKCGKDYEHGWVQRRSWWKRLFGVNK